MLNIHLTGENSSVVNRGGITRDSGIVVCRTSSSRLAVKLPSSVAANSTLNTLMHHARPLSMTRDSVFIGFF